jgi:cytochrome bd-type quinol oxidase subunit 2
MRSSTKISVWAIVIFTILSCLPYGFADRPKVLFDGNGTIVGTDNSSMEVAQYWAIGISIVGLLFAGFFDLKAERIKRRGQGALPRGTVRWYHFVFIILFPYLAIFWGIINLLTGRKQSGKVLLIGSLLMLALLIAIFSGAIHPPSRSK